MRVGLIKTFKCVSKAVAREDSFNSSKMSSWVTLLGTLFYFVNTNLLLTAAAYNVIYDDLGNQTAKISVCEDNIPNCSALKKHCRHWSDLLKYSCAKTCGYCGDGCEDEGKDCHKMTEYCTIYPKLKKTCRKSCGFCGTKDHVSCKRDLKKIGCFQAVNSTQMDLLIDDSNVDSPYYQGFLLNWKDYKKSVHSLACRCKKKAVELGYIFISLRFWGKCWAGRDFGIVQQSPKSYQCFDPRFEPCDDKNKDECVGSAGNDYVYKLSTKAPSPPSECRDTRSDCHLLKDMCRTSPNKLKVSCAKTCGFCSDDCVDKKDYCDTVLHPYCDIPGYRQSMEKYCRKTCNFCGPQCTDRYRNCSSIQSYCLTNPSRLVGHCDLTCGFCKAGVSGKIDICKDKRSDCKSLRQYCGVPQFKKDMMNYCPKTCEFCVRNPCMDSLPMSRCKYLKGLRYCARNPRMEILCPETCEFCSLPAPTECSVSKYGCCWDRETLQKREDGRDCRPCEDRYTYICQQRKYDCGKEDEDGEFVRTNCPQTCGLCTDPCQDDPLEGYKCKFWKTKLGYCATKQKEMLHLCPATCGYC